MLDLKPPGIVEVVVVKDWNWLIKELVVTHGIVLLLVVEGNIITSFQAHVLDPDPVVFLGGGCATS